MAPKQEEKIFEGFHDLFHETTSARAMSSDLLVNWRINALVQDLNRANFRSMEVGIEIDVLNDLTLRMRMGMPEHAGLEVSDRSRLIPSRPTFAHATQPYLT